MDRKPLIFGIVLGLCLVGAGSFYVYYMRADNCNRLVEHSVLKGSDGKHYMYTHRDTTSWLNTEKEAIRLCEQLWELERDEEAVQNSGLTN